MNADCRDLAQAVVRYLRDKPRPIAVYVGEGGAVGYGEARDAQELMPMKLAGVFDECCSVQQIETDLIAAGMK